MLSSIIQCFLLNNKRTERLVQNEIAAQIKMSITTDETISAILFPINNTQT